MLLCLRQARHCLSLHVPNKSCAAAAGLHWLVTTSVAKLCRPMHFRGASHNRTDAPIGRVRIADFACQLCLQQPLAPGWTSCNPAQACQLSLNGSDSCIRYACALNTSTVMIVFHSSTVCSDLPQQSIPAEKSSPACEPARAALICIVVSAKTLSAH